MKSCGTTTCSQRHKARMPESNDLADLPLLPRDDDGPVFAEPWQAQAFAVVVELTEAGTITREEWA